MTAEIQHEAVPGFMPAMTMPFTARERALLAQVHIGDAVAFGFDVTDADAWLTDIRKISADAVAIPATTAPPSSAGGSAESVHRLKEGDTVPQFHLTDENGRPLSPQSYEGGPWVLTFIFTRCPMPTFCPRMSGNFHVLQQKIAEGGETPAMRLLSITIDPEYDTPALLKEYGQHAGATNGAWDFATGSPEEIGALTAAFSVYTEREAGTISHGLTTALIDSRGRIARIWRGNGWTPEEVIAAARTLTAK